MGNQTRREPIRISVEDANERYEREDVTVLDAVDPGAFERTSYMIEGAVRIDPRDVRDEFEQLPKGRTVLTYCT
jgi:rhodanese-related sulfurtransferase